MSYDVAFWAEKSNCDYSAYTIYCRLRRGLAVEGLKPVIRKKTLAALQEIMTSPEITDDGLDGQIGKAAVEVTIRDCAVLFDLRPASDETVKILRGALRPLGLRCFDPSEYQGPEVDPLYGMTYEEKSEDPDPGYWTELKFSAAALKRCKFDGRKALGAQWVNGVDYIFFESGTIEDASEIADAINQGRTFCPPKSLTFLGVDEIAKICVVVCVPPKIVQSVSCGKPARLQVTAFSAFGDDDDVLSYESWGPDDNGACTGLFSLPSMPTRVKTILSTKFAFLG